MESMYKDVARGLACGRNPYMHKAGAPFVLAGKCIGAGGAHFLFSRISFVRLILQMTARALSYRRKEGKTEHLLFSVET